MVKVSSFVPKRIGAENKIAMTVGLKHQSGMNTLGNWAVIGGKSSSEGQHLNTLIDEDALRKLETFGMHSFLGCE